MTSTADALVQVSDHVLDSLRDLNRVEYFNRGRKYRYVSNKFQRISVESKHLVVCPELPDRNTALASAFSILLSIADGSLLSDFSDICLLILAVAQDLERHRWFDSVASLVIHLKDAKLDPSPFTDDALAYAAALRPHHSKMGFDIVVYAKLNFLFTDHHIGTELSDQTLVDIVAAHFGPDACDSPAVLDALKCFVHWGHTRAILAKLGVPHVAISPDLLASFDLFPEIDPNLRALVPSRFPSGTSRYSLMKKALVALKLWPLLPLIPFSRETPASDFAWLLNLCADIAADPVRYHLRASSKHLSDRPVNLRDLQQQHQPQALFWLAFTALILDWFAVPGGAALQHDSRLPPVDPRLQLEIDAALGHGYCEKLAHLRAQIDSYLEKGWDDRDIVSRLGSDMLGESLYSVLPHVE